ncbi:hypothetical protein [Antiquaquibacter soli]|uniref:Uncharacterized protein n=1 Tax=Antiquaquibacter soli TaxID=3064523 RepID=A0ABT9BKZ7_9MICO|nr:hypothetical protein [Protaetiibacter sp. WY-16]MDO7881690.1 hypothetical protein [Protaetiibacter sp. WY-16]
MRFLAVGLAAVVLLAGCTLYRPLPEPLGSDEIRELVQQQRREYWAELAPGEPYPEVEVVDVLPADEAWPRVMECVDALEIPGVSRSGGGLQVVEGADQHALEVAIFRCYEAYPPDYSDPTVWGFLSEDEREYLWQYFDGFLVPCLILHGYSVHGMPGRESFLASEYLAWEPYGTLTPAPLTPQEWQWLDAQCPPPPLLRQWLWRPDGSDEAP